jgi:hypothetical protein
MEGSFVNEFISCPDVNNYGNFRPLSTTVFFCAKVALETRLESVSTLYSVQQ